MADYGKYRIAFDPRKASSSIWKDLIGSHISVDTKDIKEVLRRLIQLKIPYETNISVPKANENEGFVTQFFLRDPDGYYIEICNCY